MVKLQASASYKYLLQYFMYFLLSLSFWFFLHLRIHPALLDLDWYDLILIIVNPNHATGLFLYPLKTLENQRFSDVFRGYKKWLAEWNGLTSSCIFTYLSAHKIITCSLYYRLAWLVVDLNVNYFHSLIFGSFLQEPKSESILIHIWRPRFGGKAKMRCYWTLGAASPQQVFWTSNLYFCY